MKILITSGGTRVPLDSVRYIGNMSTGRYGAQLAEAVHAISDNGYDAKHELIFFRAKDSVQPFTDYKYEIGLFLDDPDMVKDIIYKDYYEYLNVKELIKVEQPDIIISCAAVSDYIPVDTVEGKISSDNDELVIRLKKAEKVIQSFRELAPNATIVGFKLLCDPNITEKYNAIRKALEYADIVIYNNLSEIKKGNNSREMYARIANNKNHFLFLAEDADNLIKEILLYNEYFNWCNW